LGAAPATVVQRPPHRLPELFDATGVAAVEQGSQVAREQRVDGGAAGPDRVRVAHALGPLAVAHADAHELETTDGAVRAVGQRHRQRDAVVIGADLADRHRPESIAVSWRRVALALGTAPHRPDRSPLAGPGLRYRRLRRRAHRRALRVRPGDHRALPAPPCARTATGRRPAPDRLRPRAARRDGRPACRRPAAGRHRALADALRRAGSQRDLHRRLGRRLRLVRGVRRSLPRRGADRARHALGSDWGDPARAPVAAAPGGGGPADRRPGRARLRPVAADRAVPVVPAAAGRDRPDKRAAPAPDHRPARAALSVTYDLHRVLGGYALVVTLTLALTGLTWSFAW